MPREFSTVDAAVRALGRGEVVIVLDAEDRENEGDFVCAAERVTPKIVNFLITHGKGLLCVPVLPETAHRLELAPMVGARPDSYRTAYTVTVDHQSVHTGITARERCHTIREMVNPTSAASDFVRPGHVLPLV